MAERTGGPNTGRGSFRALRPPRVTRLEAACAMIVGAGIGLRALSLIFRSWADDTWRYAAYAESLLRFGEFLVPWSGALEYTQHYPPLYPAWLAAFFAAMGPTKAAVMTASFVASLVLLAVTYATTRDLYGRRAGAIVTAIVAAAPWLIGYDMRGLGESMVAATFTLTIWAIVRSLREPWFIVLGGLFAGLGYLAKSSMGPFFVLAGLAGFAWRFAYVRWRVFRDRHYIAAAGIFLAFVLAWGGRNVARHGWPNWETQRYAGEALRHLFDAAPWPTLLLRAAAAVAVALVLMGLPFLDAGRDAWRRVREESTSALWMAVVTPSIVAVFFVAAFASTEGYDPLGGDIAFRYVVVSLTPLLWLLLRDLAPDLETPPGPPSEGASRVTRRAVLAWSGIAVLAVTLALSPLPLGLTLGRVLAMYLAVVVGIALVAASRLSEWTPATRTRRDGTIEWRAAPGTRGRGPMTAFAILLSGLLVSFYWTFTFFPLFVAASAGFLLGRPGERTVAVAVLLLASSATGLYVDEREGDVAAFAAATGGAVGMLDDEEARVWPLLPEGTRLVARGQPADVLVDLGAGPVPENTTVLAEFPSVTHAMPGTWLLAKLMGIELTPGRVARVLTPTS